MLFRYSYIYIFIYYGIDVGIFYYFDYKLIFIRIFYNIAQTNIGLGLFLCVVEKKNVVIFIYEM